MVAAHFYLSILRPKPNFQGPAIIWLFVKHASNMMKALCVNDWLIRFGDVKRFWQETCKLGASRNFTWLGYLLFVKMELIKTMWRPSPLVKLLIYGLWEIHVFMWYIYVNVLGIKTWSCYAFWAVAWMGRRRDVAGTSLPVKLGV